VIALSSWVLALGLAGIALGCATAPRAPSEFVQALHADAALPSMRESLRAFGQFVGSWDMDITFYDESGKVAFHGPGRWVFDWVLDGRAVQDVITCGPIDAPSKVAPGERRIGTTLRHYDPSSGTWRVVFLGASSGALVVLTGTPAGDRIVLEGSEGAGIRNRWTFSAIEKGSFHWRGEISRDGGATWRVEQEMEGKRASGAG
jgi:hypothetical protein